MTLAARVHDVVAIDLHLGRMRVEGRGHCGLSMLECEPFDTVCRLGDDLGQGSARRPTCGNGCVVHAHVVGVAVAARVVVPHDERRPDYLE